MHFVLNMFSSALNEDTWHVPWFNSIDDDTMIPITSPKELPGWIAMRRPQRRLIAVCCLVLVMLAAWWGRTPVADAQPQPSLEDEIHRVPGRKTVGQPATKPPVPGQKLQIKVVDAAGQPTFCRVNVIGSDGQFYEPAEHLLAPWSLSRLGNRLGKGPFRYYGWFFYSNGQCEVVVPPGETRIEVWKGFEYRPTSTVVNASADAAATATLMLEQIADMATRGWYSGDTHIHLDRRVSQDDERSLDLTSAEDIRFGHILCMNDPRTYQPLMDQQIWHQLQGMGQKSVRQRGLHAIASGQEYRCGTYGHICLIGGSRLVDADGLKTDPNQWPLFGMVADELHGIGGFAFHAHGGYEQEIYADFAQRATDGVELLQFAEYRGIGLAGWYHILNAGYRFPAVGASDYPYCRALGDCRTYVHISGQPTFEAWNQGAAAGHSFFTTGPLVELTVNNRYPGEAIDLDAASDVRVHLRIQSLVSPISDLQLIVGGEIRERRNLSSTSQGAPLELDLIVPATKSTWIAARVLATGAGGREDSEAHSNPVYVMVGKQPILNRASVEWLVRKLDQQIETQAARKFERREQVLAYYRKSRDVLMNLIEAKNDPGRSHRD